MSSLREKLLKTSTIKKTAVMSESTFFNNVVQTPTLYPALNIALSGTLTGGIQPGILQVAGPSKHFKSSIVLVMVSAYLKAHKDSILLFYDSEFGSGLDYIRTYGIDPSRVVHTPLTDIEDLTIDIMAQLNEITNKDKVIIMIDSVGNLASKKEVADAKSGEVKVDMSRAKSLKSVFRMVTPHLKMKDIPLLVINHTYQTQEMYSKTVTSGGTGLYYSSNDIWIIGRSQEKDGTELAGFTFTINIEKSRTVKEKSKIPLLVTFKGGISKFSGLLELALESGHVIKPSNGWYSKVDMTTGEIHEGKVREKDTKTSEFWESILSDKKFHQFVKDKYFMMQSDDSEELPEFIDETEEE